MNNWIAIISHKHGDNIYQGRTQVSVRDQVTNFAWEWWSQAFPDRPMERYQFTWDHVEEYFEEMTGVESYVIHEPESTEDPPSTECTVYISGGLVQWVAFNGKPLAVQVIDSDTDGAFEGDLYNISHTDGKKNKALLYGAGLGFNSGNHKFIEEEE